LTEVTTLRINGPGLFSLTGAAKVLGLPQVAVRELIDNGELPALRVGGRDMVTAVAVAELLADLNER
jgi:excisionase family DNA binding protein